MTLYFLPTQIILTPRHLQEQANAFTSKLIYDFQGVYKHIHYGVRALFCNYIVILFEVVFLCCLFFCLLFFLQIKLADKQAALEKMQWEAMTSRRKAEKLQEELNSMQGDISSYMQLFEGLMKNNSTKYSENYDVTPYRFDHLPYLVSSNTETSKLISTCVFSLALYLSF